MDKKFELTTETMTNSEGVVLHRIKALRSFNYAIGSTMAETCCLIRKGQLGGWVQSESNLSQTGGCWVFPGAAISGNARVSGYANVSGNAIVSGNAEIKEVADVRGDAKITGNAIVSSKANVLGNAIVSENARVYGWVEDAYIHGTVGIGGNESVRDACEISSEEELASYLKEKKRG